MQAVYSTVRENFKRIQDFGWYLPSHHSIASFKLLNGDTSVSSESGLEGESSTRLFYRRAAVLFLLSMWKGELHVLMTKRSQAVRTHKGKLEMTPTFPLWMATRSNMLVDSRSS